MPELSSLMNEIPESLGGSVATADDLTEDDDQEEEEQEQETDQGKNEDDDQEEDSDSEEQDDEEGEDDEYDTDLDDDEKEDKKPPAASTVAPQPQVTDENKFILDGLSKINTRIIVTGADGKDEVKEVQAYGWGDLPRDFKGFATPYEQGVFTSSVQAQEIKARELQTQFRQNKLQADAEAYTLRENRAVARDLRELRKDGMFPKFKGIPGSSEFNSSEGAKMFDEVIQFMNEQNDEAGKAANKGDAFYHISFKQAYRMLHPEVFDTKGRQAQQNARRNAARKTKTRPGQSPDKKANVQNKRVNNITDLAGEFEQFVGSSK